MATIKTLDGPEGITLAEAKAHLRIDHSAEDALIQTYITAARGAAETQTGRAISVSQYRLALDTFPDGPIELSACPLISVQSLKYFNEVGFQDTVSGQDYFLDTVGEPGWISPAAGLIWPVTQERINAVEINFTAGYAIVPADLKAWMLLAIAELYERRTLSSEKQVFVVSMARGLLDRYKIWGV